MANPARKYEERPDERAVDPLAPVPPLSTDPVTADPRFQAANDPRVEHTTVVQSRGAGNGVLIAALVIVLAVIAYFVFAPGAPETTVPADQPATTSEPATPAPATPAPDATAPAAPADPATPAPDATAPAAPADPAAPAPDANAPAAPAPAEPAPAPAPAQ